MKIAVDFDGTCVTHEFPFIGKDIGAAPILEELVRQEHQIILNTMRCDQSTQPTSKNPDIKNIAGNHLSEAVKWFETNSIPLYGINNNPEQSSWTTSPKIYAELYIDDAALGCPLVYPSGKRPYVDWAQVYKILKLNGILK